MSETKEKKSWWPFKSTKGSALLDINLVTIVPIEIAVQKLRGFISDQSANIINTSEDHIELEVIGGKEACNRREEDRPITFVIDMKFEEKRVARSNAQGFAAGEYVETYVRVVIRPKKSRDRRQEMATDRARHMLSSLKSYLMAKTEEEHAKEVANLPEIVDA